jgi:predicted metal-dependent phosphoesterase TrpH
MHSTASDGTLPVEELMKLAASVGLKTIALTDHDTTAALDAAIQVGHALGMEVIPGIELSADDDGNEVHVLGYFINYHDEKFQQELEKFRDTRVGRAEAMVQKLGQLGLPISYERVLEIAGGAAPQRPHIAEALKEAGYVATVKEAFDKYISNNGPAYVDRVRIGTVESVKLIQSVGGLAVMAHPTYVKNVETVLPPMVEAGLVGMEIHYGYYDEETVASLLTLANQYNLVATGGSDYHGRADGGQIFIGERIVPPVVIEQLKARLR